MRSVWCLGERDYEVAPLAWPSNGVCLRLPGGDGVASLGQDPEQAVLSLNGTRHSLRVVRHGDDVHIHYRGRSYHLRRLDPLASAAVIGSGSQGELRAPMPGMVVSIDLTPGMQVREGQRLLAMESMKLLSELVAPCTGKVLAVAVDMGASFDKGALLVQLEPAMSAENG